MAREPKTRTLRFEKPRGLGRDRNAPAFSFIELATIVIILSILAGIAFPRFTQSLAMQRVDAAARRVAVDLALARRYARITSKSQSVAFAPSLGRYELEGVKDVEQTTRDYRVELAGVPYQATLYSADFGGKTSVTFDGYGVPDSGGTVVVRVGVYSRSIVLDGDSGEASVQ